MHRVYLDNNSTTRIHPEVAAAMYDCHLRGYMNPASQHEEGRQARSMLEAAREGIGRLLGARLDHSDGDRVIFTSGGTESNNLALRGLAGKPNSQRSTSPATSPVCQPRIVVSSIEHPSLAETADHLERSGWEVRKIPVDQQGVLQTNTLDELLGEHTVCVSAMLGNHETGVLQPISEVVETCRPREIPVHTDAVQVTGKMPVSFRELDVDALTASAHKFHGPRGIGVLIVRSDTDLEPILTGGSQQLGIRPGTESVGLAVGMWRALEIWDAAAEENERRMRGLRDRLESDLRNAIPEVVIHGQDAPRLPQTTNLSIPGLDRQAMLLALDRAGVACSTGSACTSGSSEPSPVLMAMGCREPVIEGSLRLSLGVCSTREEIEFCVAKIVDISRHLATFRTHEKRLAATRDATRKRV